MTTKDTKLIDVRIQLRKKVRDPFTNDRVNELDYLVELVLVGEGFTKLKFPSGMVMYIPNRDIKLIAWEDYL